MVVPGPQPFHCPSQGICRIVRVKEQLEAVRQIPSWDVSRCVEMFRGCKFEHVASKCVSCLCRPDAKIPMKQVVDRSWDLFHSRFILCACTEYSFFSHDLYTNLHFILNNYPFMLPSINYNRSSLIKVLSRAASNCMCFLSSAPPTECLSFTKLQLAEPQAFDHTYLISHFCASRNKMEQGIRWRTRWNKHLSSSVRTCVWIAPSL